jgi:serine protease Do
MKRFFIATPAFLALTLCLALAGAARAELPEFTTLVEKAGPAVVNISTVKTVKGVQPPQEFFQKRGPGQQQQPYEDFFDQFDRFFGNQQGRKPFKQRASGSGFLISADGYIVTNNHVIAEADEVKVTFPGQDKPITAKVVGRDQEADLALIKIDGKSGLPHLEFADSDAVKVGQWVLAIGNPFGLHNTVTKGIISATGRVIGAGPFDNFIQTDASINPGNSGGPLINMDGKVVGVNSAIIASGQGIGFAIPSNMARDTIGQLRENKAVKRGWLGVTIQDIDENTAKALGLQNTKGSLVTSVIEGEPAQKAGVATGDVITAVSGQSVDDSNMLLRRVAAIKPGDSAKLAIWRKGQTITLTVNLGERDLAKTAKAGQTGPEGHAEQTVLGLTVHPVERQEAKALGLDKPAGLLITAIGEGSPAEDTDIRAGDVILEVNQHPVNSTGDFKRIAAEDGRAKGVVMLLIKRQKQNIIRTIPVKDKE